MTNIKKHPRNGVFFRKYEEVKKQQKGMVTPTQKFVNDVARVTKKSPHTVRMWLSGCIRPDKLAVETLAAHWGVDKNVLFI